MPSGSQENRNHRYAYSDQECANRRNRRHFQMKELQKCCSDNNYNQQVRYGKFHNAGYDDKNDYGRGSNRHSKRYKGGAENNMDCSQQSFFTCERDSSDMDIDFFNPVRNHRTCSNGDSDRNFDREPCYYHKDQRVRCRKKLIYCGSCDGPCDRRCRDSDCGGRTDRDSDRDRREYQDSGHDSRKDFNSDRVREKTRKSHPTCCNLHIDDDFDHIFEKTSQNPFCVKIHRVSHVCNEFAGSSCIPKSCLAFKSKNQGSGDGVGADCCNESCPFCLLRLFCTEVLQELAEIKAKQLGGELEGLIHAPEGFKEVFIEQKRTSKLAFGEKKASFDDTDDFHKRTKSSEFNRSLDNLDRRRDSLSNDSYSRDGTRGRQRLGPDGYFRDEIRGRQGLGPDGYFRNDIREKPGRGSYNSLEQDRRTDRGNRNRYKERDRKGGRDDDNEGEVKKAKNNKKDKQQKISKEEKPVELPDEVKQELEKARKIAEKVNKKKEADRAKKTLIEMRLQNSLRLSNKGCKAFAVKPYSGPGRFAEVNICDFMKLRLESLIEKDAALKRSMWSPNPCIMPCVPPVCSINPNYCCTSFWCPQPRIAGICC